MIELPEKHDIREINGRKEWFLSEPDLECIALGSGILGCGGGFSNYIALKIIQEMRKQGKEFRIVALEDVTEQDSVSISAFLGAPMVAIEKIPSGTETLLAMETLRDYVRTKGSDITALLSGEIGGMNSIAPIYTAAQMDLPTIDADAMGRAFPSIQQVSFYIYKLEVTPCAFATEKGQSVLYERFEDNQNETMEPMMYKKHLHPNGAILGTAWPPLNKSELLQYGIPGSVSRCWRLGRALLVAWKQKDDLF